MARSLPLGPPVLESPATSPPSLPMPEVPRLTGTVHVFDPPMCCPTGVCGPGVDPALIQVARDLRWLTSRGAEVVRAGLAQEPQAFVANDTVARLMRAHGDAALPTVLVNGVVVVHGRYPTRDELLAALATPGDPASDDATPDLRDAGPRAPTGGQGGCCAPGSDCR